MSEGEMSQDEMSQGRNVNQEEMSWGEMSQDEVSFRKEEAEQSKDVKNL